MEVGIIDACVPDSMERARVDGAAVGPVNSRDAFHRDAFLRDIVIALKGKGILFPFNVCSSNGECYVNITIPGPARCETDVGDFHLRKNQIAQQDCG